MSLCVTPYGGIAPIFIVDIYVDGCNHGGISTTYEIGEKLSLDLFSIFKDIYFGNLNYGNYGKLSLWSYHQLL